MHRYIRLVALAVLVFVGVFPRDTAANAWWQCHTSYCNGSTRVNWCEFAYPHGGGSWCGYEEGIWEGVCDEMAANDGSVYEYWYYMDACDDSVYGMPEGDFYCSWPNAWSCQ